MFNIYVYLQKKRYITCIYIICIVTITHALLSFGLDSVVYFMFEIIIIITIILSFFFLLYFWNLKERILGLS